MVSVFELPLVNGWWKLPQYRSPRQIKKRKRMMLPTSLQLRLQACGCFAIAKTENREEKNVDAR
jgi:hypothetical protein